MAPGSLHAASLGKLPTLALRQLTGLPLYLSFFIKIPRIVRAGARSDLLT